MGRTRSGLIIGALLAFSVGAVTACGGAGTGGQSPESSGSAAAVSPLDEYLGGGDAKPEDDEKAKAQQHQMQELVASCMKKQGFDYIPYDGALTATVSRKLGGDSGGGDRDWTAKYGYGITTTEQVKPAADDKDPNQAAMEKMSASERKAYQTALFGFAAASNSSSSGGGAVVAIGPGGPVVAAQPGGAADSGAAGSKAPNSGATGSLAAEPADVGCFGTANTKVFGERPQVNMADFDDLFKALDAMHTRIDADPRVAPLVTAWAGCMADAGHPGYKKITDPQDSIMQKWSELNGWNFQRGEGGISVGGPALAATGSDKPAGPDQQKTAKLRTEEIALALADFDCRKDYRTTSQTVRLELERAFVAAHKAELERYRDAVNGGR